MNRLQVVREERLRKDALRCGLIARKATDKSRFDQVADVWDFARIGDAGEPGDDSSLSGAMSFDDARGWIAEAIRNDVVYPISGSGDSSSH